MGLGTSGIEVTLAKQAVENNGWENEHARRNTFSGLRIVVIPGASQGRLRCRQDSRVRYVLTRRKGLSYPKSWALWQPKNGQVLHRTISCHSVQELSSSSGCHALHHGSRPRDSCGRRCKKNPGFIA